MRAMSDVILLLDRDGRYLKISDGASGRLFRTREELIGHRLHDVFPGARADTFLGYIHTALDEGRPVEAEYTLEIGGQTVYFAASISPITNDTVVWVARDVTAQRVAEAALRRQALVFETIHDAVLVMDLDGRILEWNPAAERIFGYRRDEAIGRTPQLFQRPDVAPTLEPEINAAVRTRGRWEGEVPFVRRDGSEGIADAIVVLQRDERGEPVGIIGVNRDVTGRRRVEEALRRSEERLQQAQKIEAVGRLAGGIAHDFNNLLTAISTSAELALAALSDGHPARADMQEIREAAHRAARLTTQLLAFSRRQVLQPSIVDLNVIVGDAERMLRRVLRADIALLTALDPELGLVHADRGQIDQVLMNLFVNARDAMPEGGAIVLETANVEVGDEPHELGVASGQWVVLRVRDTGVGMDAPTRERIFEPFFTTKDAAQSAGLGLATVYGIVEQSGGQVFVESAPGAGSVFHVFLPRAEEPALAGVAEADRVLPRGTETVLLAEDEQGVRASVRRILEKQGYHVIEATNGVQALRVREEMEGPLHLLLTDVVMPEMGGFELASRLRAKHPDLKVLLMSGYPDGAGFAPPLGAAFVAKPFTAEALVRQVRELLDAPG
jgi:PAS domain S-box-containing protein